MRAALIENGIVINVIEVDDLDIIPNLVQSDMASIGDSWDGQNFHRQNGQVIVPESVEMLNARLALINAGLIDSVQAFFDGIIGPDGDAARAYWQYAKTVRRDNAYVEQARISLGLTNQQIDDLFIQASQLSA